MNPGDELGGFISHFFYSAIIGILAGSGAVVFHILLTGMRNVFDPQNIPARGDFPVWTICFIPVFGALVLSAISQMFPLIARQRGILSAIKALIQKNGFIPFRVTLFHFFTPIIAIGTGHPLGPEAPAAKLGSGIGSFISQKLHISSAGMRTYTAAGAGAAIAAVFNAPITGVFFGIEVMLLHDMKNEALSALIVSSVVADILSRAILGNHHIITVPFAHLGSLHSYHWFLLLGLLCGFLSMFYFCVKKQLSVLINVKLKINNIYMHLVPIAAVFGIVVMFYYPLFGLGYHTMNDTLRGLFSLDYIAVLLVLNIVFLALFLVCGSYGGTFAPSLGIGVFAGYLLAGIINMLTGASLDPVTFALIGMGGMLAGINNVPLTSIMLVFEITNDYRLVLPLMLVSVISYVITVYLNRGTIYSRGLLRLGIDVSRKAEVNLLGKIKVSEIMSREFTKVSHRLPFERVMDELKNSAHGDAVVVNDRDELEGIISLRDMRHVMMSNDLVNLIIAGDIASSVPIVTEDEPVSDVTRRLEQYSLENVPVVNVSDKTKVTGFLTQADIISAYTRLLREWEEDQVFINFRSVPGDKS